MNRNSEQYQITMEDMDRQPRKRPWIHGKEHLSRGYAGNYHQRCRLDRSAGQAGSSCT